MQNYYKTLYKLYVSPYADIWISDIYNFIYEWLFKKYITNKVLITPETNHSIHPRNNDEMKPTSVPKETAE